MGGEEAETAWRPHTSQELSPAGWGRERQGRLTGAEDPRTPSCPSRVRDSSGLPERWTLQNNFLFDSIQPAVCLSPLLH